MRTALKSVGVKNMLNLKKGGEKNMKKRILSILVAIFMLISLVQSTGCGGGGSSSGSSSSGSVAGSGK